MKIERNYLTANEIRYISDMISEIDDFMTREYIKYLTVANFCTDIKLSVEDTENGEQAVVWKEEDYNNLVAEGDIEKLNNSIKNIYLIDLAVEYKHSTYNMLKDLTDKLSNSIKDFDINETKEVLSQIDNLVNKEEK